MRLKSFVGLGVILLSSCSPDSGPSSKPDDESPNEGKQVTDDQNNSSDEEEIDLDSRNCEAVECAEAMSSDPKAPRIKDIELLTRPDIDPWLLIFSIEFEDSNGDLAQGRVDASISLNPVSRDIDSLFRQRGLAADAKEGRFALLHRFQETNSEQIANIHIQLVDSAGLRSNCYSLDLDVQLNDAP